MPRIHLDPDTTRAALAVAAHAPSVHNSQPWRWRLDPAADLVELHADRARWPAVTDAEGRDLLLSCGAALHHLLVGLSAVGCSGEVDRLPDPGDPDLIAAVRLRDRPDGTARADERTAVETRRTDRRPYLDWPVPEQFVVDLTARAAAHGALLRPVADGRARSELERAIRAAASAHATDPGYLAERDGPSGPWDGVPAANVPRSTTATDLPQRYGTGELDPGTAPMDGAALLVLGSSSDDRLAQLRAGEALSAVLLGATGLGLATCPLTEPIEVPRTRALVRDRVLDGTLCPQVVIRVGWAPPGAVPRTPRRPLADQVERWVEPPGDVV